MSSLGSISPIIVNRWNGFDYPERAKFTNILGDGASSTGNAMAQQSALGYPVSSISGVIDSSANLATLRGYAEAKTLVDFVHGATTYNDCVVMDLRVSRVMTATDLTWEFTCTLVQTGATA